MADSPLRRFGWLPALMVRQRRRFAVGIFFVLVYLGSTLLIPYLVQLIVDRLVERGAQAEVGWAIAAMVAALGVENVALFFRDTCFLRASDAAIADLKGEVFEHLLRQDIAFFDGARSGELTSRLSADTAILQVTLSSEAMYAFQHALTVLIGCALLVVTSPALALVAMVTGPPVALAISRATNRISGLSHDAQQALATANATAQEGIQGVRTVRLLDLEDAFAARYGAALRAAVALTSRRVATHAAMRSIGSFLGRSLVPLLLGFGAHLVTGGALTEGALIAFILYATSVASSFGDVLGFAGQYARAEGAARRVLELLARRPQAQVGGATLSEVAGAIRFEGVCFTYAQRPEVPVLRGIDLEVAAGEVVALVGGSGAGKSTIVSLITRLHEPGAGRILLDGADIGGLAPRWLRSMIGVVEQDPVLFEVTIAENIGWGRPGASEEQILAAARVANAADFIQNLPSGLRTLVGERGVQLSGGQRQRIAIARAVLRDPRVLILDEATSALDAESEAQVQEALERLMRGRTCLVIAHRLSTVARADRILVLEGGRIVASGGHQDLLQQSDSYRQLFAHQLVGVGAS